AGRVGESTEEARLDRRAATSEEPVRLEDAVQRREAVARHARVEVVLEVVVVPEKRPGVGPRDVAAGVAEAAEAGAGVLDVATKAGQLHADDDREDDGEEDDPRVEHGDRR